MNRALRRPLVACAAAAAVAAFYPPRGQAAPASATLSPATSGAASAFLRSASSATESAVLRPTSGAASSVRRPPAGPAASPVLRPASGGAGSGFSAASGGASSRAGDIPSELSPLEIFERAKAVFRAVKRPPYVVYTLHRRETVDGSLDFLSTYTMRVWCRTADDAALSRRMWRGKTYGDLEFIRPVFNGPIDPGPPTADLFQPAPPRSAENRPQPEPTATLPTLAEVIVRGELDYRVTLAGVDRDAYHLRLAAVRDPGRNRLRELWIDRRTFELRRLTANDTLFYLGTGVERPEILDVTLRNLDGVPLIGTIHATTAFDVDSSGMGEREEGDYTFDDVSFPPSLPAWYFEPTLYGAYFADAPGA